MQRNCYRLFVEAQRGIADHLNQQTFEALHRHFRVLSLVADLFPTVGDGGVLPDDAESGEDATLMWSHYADQFQGVCLVLNPTAFDNGIKAGGITVQYPAEAMQFTSLQMPFSPLSSARTVRPSPLNGF
jgi:hypothetical protein